MFFLNQLKHGGTFSDLQWEHISLLFAFKMVKRFHHLLCFGFVLNRVSLSTEEEGNVWLLALERRASMRGLYPPVVPWQPRQCSSALMRHCKGTPTALLPLISLRFLVGSSVFEHSIWVRHQVNTSGLTVLRDKECCHLHTHCSRITERFLFLNGMIFSSVWRDCGKLKTGVQVGFLFLPWVCQSLWKPVVRRIQAWWEHLLSGLQ